MLQNEVQWPSDAIRQVVKPAQDSQLPKSDTVVLVLSEIKDQMFQKLPMILRPMLISFMGDMISYIRDVISNKRTNYLLRTGC